MLDKSTYYLLSAFIVIIAISFSSRSDAQRDAQQAYISNTSPFSKPIFTPENCDDEVHKISIGEKETIEGEKTITFVTAKEKVELRMMKAKPPSIRVFSIDQQYELELKKVFQTVYMNDMKPKLKYSGIFKSDGEEGEEITKKIDYTLAKANWTMGEVIRECSPDTKFAECVRFTLRYPGSCKQDKAMHQENSDETKTEPAIELTVSFCETSLKVSVDLHVQDVHWHSAARFLSVCFATHEMSETSFLSNKRKLQRDPLTVIYHDKRDVYFGSSRVQGFTTLSEDTFFRVSTSATGKIRNSESPVTMRVTQDEDSLGNKLMCLTYNKFLPGKQATLKSLEADDLGLKEFDKVALTHENAINAEPHIRIVSSGSKSSATAASLIAILVLAFML